MFKLQMPSYALLIVVWRWWTRWSRPLLPTATACRWHLSACWILSGVSRVWCSPLLTPWHHQLVHLMCLYLNQWSRVSVQQIQVSLCAFHRWSLSSNTVQVWLHYCSFGRWCHYCLAGVCLLCQSQSITVLWQSRWYGWELNLQLHCEPKNTPNVICYLFYKTRPILIKFGTYCPE